MRKVVVSEFISLDGVIEAPGPDGSGYKYAGWAFDYSSEDTMKFKYDELMAADAQLLGRVTYEGFAKAWPKMQGTGEFGEKMNSMQKYVASKSLKKAEWNNSTIIKDSLKEEVMKIKSMPGKNILVAGSSKLVQSLIENDLVDEFQLLVYPVVLGTGKKLFVEDNKIRLKLTQTQSFKSGVVLLSYETVRS